MFGNSVLKSSYRFEVAIVKYLYSNGLASRDLMVEPVPSEERLIRLGIHPNWLHGVNGLRRGRKCDFCRQTGVSGRKAIFEALIVDDEVKIAIQEQAPALQLRRILEAKGEAGLFERAVREAASGVISLEEACKFREVGEASLFRPFPLVAES